MYIFCEEYENIEKNYQILFILNLYFNNVQITPYLFVVSMFFMMLHAESLLSEGCYLMLVFLLISYISSSVFYGMYRYMLIEYA